MAFTLSNQRAKAYASDSRLVSAFELVPGAAIVVGHNVFRDLQVIQAKLRYEVISILDSRHRLSIDGVKECLEEVTENPEHSILILLFNETHPLRASLPRR